MKEYKIHWKDGPCPREHHLMADSEEDVVALFWRVYAHTAHFNAKVVRVEEVTYE
tara:strand:+ start:10589 stop:10753 length:165 start_codon:yes stop_codon:yes gene_type:complete